MSDLDGELQAIADKQHLHAQIDDLGPRDYAVLIRFKHADEKGQSGGILIHRMCFRHVAFGLMEEARNVLSRDDEV